MHEATVEAAGGVVVRGDDGHREVLVVHRPRYDDWSLPKGKLDPGETYEDAAVREVAEETGVRVELLDELEPTSYRDRKDRFKVVRYWLMRPLEDRHRPPDEEIDDIRWLTWEEAEHMLSYPHDRALLDEARRALP